MYVMQAIKGRFAGKYYSGEGSGRRNWTDFVDAEGCLSDSPTADYVGAATLLRQYDIRLLKILNVDGAMYLEDVIPFTA